MGAASDGSGEPSPDDLQHTRVLRGRASDREPSPRDILIYVYRALQEKGYDPVRQIAHYLLTGEPAYITAHQNARHLVTRMERDEALEELVRFYLSQHGA